MNTDETLINAVIENDIKAVSKLLTNSSCTQQIDNNGNTPLHLAVIQQSIGIVELLLTVNCELYAQNNDGFTALKLAEQTENHDLIKKIRFSIFARALDRADNVSSAHINMNKEDMTGKRKETYQLKIGLGQMLVEGGKFDDNLSRAVEMIKRASEQKCKFVVLPECLDIGWTNPNALKLAQPIPGIYSDVLCSAADKFKIYVVAGLTERDGEKVYNSAVLISSEGMVLSKHRKINVLDIAQDLYSIGDCLSVTETEFGKIGVNICADNFEDAHDLANSLARMGADIILSPTAWALPPGFYGDDNPCWGWESSYIQFAKTFEVPIVGVSNVGKVNAGVWKNFSCIGNSLAVSSNGELTAKGGLGVDKHELIIAEVHVVKNKPKGTDISVMLKAKT